MADEPRLRLYFLIPFAIETYIAVTADNIEDHGYNIWFVGDHKFVPWLLRLLQSEDHKFVPWLLRLLQLRPKSPTIISKGIRLKADFGKTGGVFFIDRDGTVMQQQSGATFSLSAGELRELEKRLEDFPGVVDVRAFKGLSDVK
jgi:hypothetical protein